MLLASSVVTLKWNHAYCFYLNYYGTILFWPFCYKLLSSPSVSLTISEIWFLAFYLALIFLPLIDPLQRPHDSCSSGYSCPSPVMTANICHSGYFRNLHTHTHPRAFLWRLSVISGRADPLLRDRQRKRQALSFLHPRHFASSLRVKSNGDIYVQKAKMDCYFQSYDLTPVAWQYLFESMAYSTLNHHTCGMSEVLITKYISLSQSFFYHEMKNRSGHMAFMFKLWLLVFLSNA